MSYRPKLKICGITNIHDMHLVNDSGADFAGILVDVGYSERSLSLAQAVSVSRESSIPLVLLLCNPDKLFLLNLVEQIRPDAIQLLCQEGPDFIEIIKSAVSCEIWKSIHLPLEKNQVSPHTYNSAGVDAILIDSFDTSEGFLRIGGTGKTVDWKAAAGLVQAMDLPVFLSGGINPDNVDRALLSVKPYGIDLCSGVEAAKGKKDPDKLTALVRGFKNTVMNWEKNI